MKFTLLDRSNYFRGLLILIGKDKKISETEKSMFMELGKQLGFNKEFCSGAINELLENEYIINEAPKFSNIDVAKLFILDGIKFAFVDNKVHLYELSWLKSVADINSVDQSWGAEQFENFMKGLVPNTGFEILKSLAEDTTAK